MALSSLSFGKSWVSSTLIVQKTRHLSEIRTCHGRVLWCERRPEENGRSVIVCKDNSGLCHDLTPVGSDVGSKLNEYGGGAWIARAPGGTGESEKFEIIFSDRKKSGLWRSLMGQNAVQIAPGLSDKGDERFFYADLSFYEGSLLAVRESHICLPEGQKQIHQEIISIESGNCRGRLLAKGADFYASPRISPDGQFLAWVEWQNPYMPWDSTQLYIAPLSDPQNRQCIAGKVAQTGGSPCSVMEIYWVGNKLYALSDAAQRHYGQKEADRAWTPVCFEQVTSDHGGQVWRQVSLPPAPCEIGFPQWVFGQNSYHVFPDGRILALPAPSLSLGQPSGQKALLLYEPEKQAWHFLPCCSQAGFIPELLEDTEEGPVFAWLEAGTTRPPAIMTGQLDGPAEICRTAWCLPEEVMPEDISVARPFSFSVDGAKSPVHALFYPPASGLNCCGAEALPPLVTFVHSGPTAQVSASLSFKIQFWTSRGFAVLDVNYRGSTGYGRAWREALNGLWGVSDVHDCCEAVRIVQEKGWVDPARCVIRGSSAGGLTVLSALAQSSLFAAGTSLYGVTDLRALVRDTHRFEACYLETLIAPWPEGEAIYRARSPINWPEKIRSPVLFLHGAEDRVVPLAHAEAMHHRLSGSVLHVYPQEGHGFRAPETQADACQRELDFYIRVFNRADSGF